MEKILKYLETIIDDNATIQKWNAKKKLSLQLAGSYEYYLVRLLNDFFLLIRPYDNLAIQKIKINIAMIEEQTDIPVAVLLEKATAYKVKRLLQERIAFIAADQQVYLPFIAMHIRKMRNAVLEESFHGKFTPATQLIFLYMLYSIKEEFDIEGLSVQLNISAMTVVRGMSELSKIGAVEFRIEGQTARKKIFKRIPKREYYQIGKEYLQNPVKKTVFVSKVPDNLKAYKSGLTALGEQTMLNEPVQKIYAVSSTAEKLLTEFLVSKEMAMEELLPKIQIMQYDIERLSYKEYVDPVTLVYGLDESDERIEMAIEDLMEGEEWFGE